MKNNYIYISLSLLLLLLSYSCSEDKIGENDTGSLVGVVVTAGANVPIANARVATQPISSTVFTDSLGKFSIDNIPTGEYSVEARKEGFIAAFEPTNIVANKEVSVVLELETSTANNKPPSTPVLLAPADNEIVESMEVEFAWQATDPDNDDLTFTLELRNDKNEEVLKFENITDSTYVYSNLMLGTKYFWQITADDDINPPVISPVSTFEVITAPQDNRFLFVRNIAGNNVIYSTNESEDAGEFRLTSENLNSYRPRRNVAADRIAFLQTDGAQVDIFTMNRDGTDKRQVTSSVKPNGFNLNEINISWPPDSDYIYYPNFDKLYRIRTNGQGLELVYQTTDGSLISEVDVSENDDIIALKTNNINGYDVSIFTIDFGGNLLNTILSGVDGAASGLNLSVTNQMVLYSYDVSGFEVDNYRRLDSRLFIYNIATDTATDVSGEKPNGTNDLEPIFSPNEANIIFTNTSNDGISQKDVYSIPVDQTSAGDRTLLFNNAFMPDWE